MRGAGADRIEGVTVAVTALKVRLAAAENVTIDWTKVHERREEIIQWIYNEKGRSRAALAATVISV